MLLIPAIDLHRGEVVRLHQGRFDRVTRFTNNPLDVAQRYRDGGAEWLHVVDLDGARSGMPAHLDALRDIAALPGLKVQCGGGIRSGSSVAQFLAAGASRVVVGSTAVEDSARVEEWMTRFGPDRITLALDVRLEGGTPLLSTRGWETQTKRSLWEVLDAFGEAARHVLCTDIGRDGALSGPNTALYAECVQRYPAVRFQASGGVRSRADLDGLAAIPTAAVIVGKALLDNRIALEEVASFLPNA
ncbi:MAG: HisA/HisF-related TIM barrel protein [Pseudomonadota bacterium]